MVVTVSAKICRENCDDEFMGAAICAYNYKDEKQLLFNDECEFEKYKCLHPNESWYDDSIFHCTCDDYAKHQKHAHFCH